MKFDTPATQNPIDQLKVVGKPTDRIDGKYKTTGTAPYAYERHDVAANQAYGYVIGAGIAKGRIRAMQVDEAKRAPGVLAIVTTLDTPRLERGTMNTAYLFGGDQVQHYHQAIAVVVAETFEEARAASFLVRVDYAPEAGKFDLAAEAGGAKPVPGDSGEGSGGNGEERVGDFEGAFAKAPVTVDATYTTADESHAMMEPHATVAAWDGDKVTLWTSNQMIAWGHGSVAKILGIPKENVRIDSPYVGGGFGGKLFVRADAVLAALGAKAAGRPVKVALTRPLIANNTTHRPATIQRVRIGAT
ncbi:xanthine dehydrogenase family protein molybdopterin-binding subunit, partial [Methylobacterium sp. W2]|uniref:molybdopterin cofactor-binding domain-containing protein n=1 Tax=Methylobacterium sp. W2 TaxID=2598107 RepID=UPI001D0CD4F3